MPTIKSMVGNGTVRISLPALYQCFKRLVIILCSCSNPRKILRGCHEKRMAQSPPSRPNLLMSLRVRFSCANTDIALPASIVQCDEMSLKTLKCPDRVIPPQSSIFEIPFILSAPSKSGWTEELRSSACCSSRLPDLAVDLVIVSSTETDRRPFEQDTIGIDFIADNVAIGRAQ